MSTLIRNVPIVNLLEVSPFVLMWSRTSQWHSMSRVGGRGGKGRQLSPFPPAHRLIELHCAHRDYVLLFFVLETTCSR